MKLKKLKILSIVLIIKNKLGGWRECECWLNPEDPVCGVDGITYPNRCMADCTLTDIECEGECPCVEQCFNECPPCNIAVCGMDGISYENHCHAECNHTTDACTGKCPCNPANCEDILDPVCGKDGITYKNPCQASSSYVLQACKGQCPCKICDCPETYTPCCGTDGVTYDNICELDCAQVFNFNPF